MQIGPSSLAQRWYTLRRLSRGNRGGYDLLLARRASSGLERLSHLERCNFLLCWWCWPPTIRTTPEREIA